MGAGFALPRDAGRRPVASSPGGGPLSHAILPLRGTRREGSHPDGWGLRRRGPAGRCAGPHRENCPEVGVPSRPPLRRDKSLIPNDVIRYPEV